jgi:hypothetical protein
MENEEYLTFELDHDALPDAPDSNDGATFDRLERRVE